MNIVITITKDRNGAFCVQSRDHSGAARIAPQEREVVEAAVKILSNALSLGSISLQGGTTPGAATTEVAKEAIESMKAAEDILAKLPAPAMSPTMAGTPAVQVTPHIPKEDVPKDPSAGTKMEIPVAPEQTDAPEKPKEDPVSEVPSVPIQLEDSGRSKEPGPETNTKAPEVTNEELPKPAAKKAAAKKTKATSPE